eukprot:14373809-Ditylum_brightwellii.AAC.1
MGGVKHYHRHPCNCDKREYVLSSENHNSTYLPGKSSCCNHQQYDDNKEYEQRTPTCIHCHQPHHHMETKFKWAPDTADLIDWEIT